MEKDKYKLGHLCICTAEGTMCYARAPQGLLGMDVYQDELTDRIFGNLLLDGKLRTSWACIGINLTRWPTATHLE